VQVDILEKQSTLLTREQSLRWTVTDITVITLSSSYQSRLACYESINAIAIAPSGAIPKVLALSTEYAS
jgi:hypothetical protein